MSDIHYRLRYVDQLIDQGNLAEAKAVCWMAQEEMASLRTTLAERETALRDERLISSQRFDELTLWRRRADKAEEKAEEAKAQAEKEKEWRIDSAVKINSLNVHLSDTAIALRAQLAEARKALLDISTYCFGVSGKTSRQINEAFSDMARAALVIK